MHDTSIANAVQLSEEMGSREAHPFVKLPLTTSPGCRKHSPTTISRVKWLITHDQKTSSVNQELVMASRMKGNRPNSSDAEAENDT